MNDADPGHSQARWQAMMKHFDEFSPKPTTEQIEQLYDDCITWVADQVFEKKMPLTEPCFRYELDKELWTSFYETIGKETPKAWPFESEAPVNDVKALGMSHTLRREVMWRQKDLDRAAKAEEEKKLKKEDEAKKKADSLLLSLSSSTKHNSLPSPERPDTPPRSISGDISPPSNIPSTTSMAPADGQLKILGSSRKNANVKPMPQTGRDAPGRRAWLRSLFTSINPKYGGIKDFDLLIQRARETIVKEAGDDTVVLMTRYGLEWEADKMAWRIFHQEEGLGHEEWPAAMSLNKPSNDAVKFGPAAWLKEWYGSTVINRLLDKKRRERDEGGERGRSASPDSRIRGYRRERSVEPRRGSRDWEMRENRY